MKIYIENFNSNWRLKALAYSSLSFNGIDINPGKKCMESRDIEQWYYIAFGIYKLSSIKGNKVLSLNEQSDFNNFTISGVIF